MTRDLIENILLEHHKEYEQDKENLRYAKKGAEEIFKRDEVERIYKQRNDISSDRGESDRIRPDERSGVRTLAERIKKTFIEEGRINLIGANVASHEELAALLQIYKNPNFETHRLIYMKEDQIVGIEGISCELPGLTMTYEPDLEPLDYVNRVNERMKELSANGYYITHNHPSGNITPSFEDTLTTYRYATGIEGFKGHIITDHTKYSFLTKDETFEFDIPEEYQIDLFENKKGNTSLLDITVSSSNQIANIAKLLDTGEGTSIILYTDTQGKINKLDELPNGFIMSKDFSAYMDTVLIGKGVVSAFCLTYNEEILNEMCKHYTNRYVRDCVLVNGKEYISAASFLVRSKTVEYAGRTLSDFQYTTFYDTDKSDMDPRQAFREIKEDAEIKHIADLIINKGCEETTTRNWISRYDDISDHLSYERYADSIDKIEAALNERDEIVDAQIVGDEIDVIYKGEYCKNLVECEEDIYFSYGDSLIGQNKDTSFKEYDKKEGYDK